jgi:hypothetical protein
MPHRKKPQRILWYEHVGFLAIILLSWADEWLDAPQHIFGGTAHGNWRESAMETLLVVLVWGAVYASTKRVLARLYYLEGFLRLCAWCRKINHGEDWLPLEQYFATGFAIETSHGICPACLMEQQRKLQDAHSS